MTTAGTVARRVRRAAYVLWRDAAKRSAGGSHHLRFALEKAQIPVLPEAYLATAWTASAAAFAIALAAGGAGVAALAAAGRFRVALLVVVLVAALFSGLVVLGIYLAYPDWRLHERRRSIERNLAPAVSYMAAMAAAGVLPAAIFRDVARQDIYREVANEARWISRDMDLFGRDLVTALDRAIERTPSPRAEEFYQGAKTTVSAGGDLRAYFVRKAEELLVQSRREGKERIEQLGILGESYVTVVVAGPLFLLVMLSVMVLFGSSASQTLAFTFLLVFVFLPLGHLGFLAAISSQGGD